MASSPPPPLPTSLPNPRKRPSMSSQASGTVNKRPKLHPLRQTSFPVAGEVAAAYASAGVRSETESVSNSVFSATSAGPKQPRGRGRPRKSQVQPVETEGRDGASQAGNAKSVVSMRSGAGAAADDDAEDENELDAMLGQDDAAAIEAEANRQADRMRRLYNAMTEEQRSRYDAWRSVGLKESVVRRIVNQTVSQSVGKSQVDAVKFYTKQFAIEIIERAREVQAEMAEVCSLSIEKEKKTRAAKVKQKQEELEDKVKEAKTEDSRLSDFEKMKLQQEISRLKQESEAYIPNKHKGGILPEHLREALRRYKKDGEGSGAGLDGMSHPLLGVHGSGAWRATDGVTGRRLFR